MTRPAPAASAPPRGSRRGDSAEHFRLMADSAPVMIWVAGPDRRCVYVNRPWLEFTGRPLEEELGTGWLDAIHPDDREAVIGAHERGFAERCPFEVEFRMRRRDGECRWLIAKGNPLLADERLSGFIGSCLDITERRAAEHAARKHDEEFKALAAHIPDAIARFDRELRCAYANRASEGTFGIAPEGLVGRGPEALPAEIGEAVARAARAALAGAREERFTFTARNGRSFVGRAIPQSTGRGAAEGVLLIAYDDTARAREDEERAALLAREREARASAESATLARDQFLAVVSHELRSPLNGIKSWTHVLDSQLKDGTALVRRALSGIMIGVDQQVRLIEDLLDVTRALSGHLGLARRPMPLVPALADAVEAMRATAIEKGIRVETDYALADGEVDGDPDRLRQVFVNLVANAVKFTPPGGTIEVSARREGAMALVEVVDDGAGIPPEFLPHVFDPFRQADQGSSRRSQDGLGLGLALVQRLAELHGGHATCESEGLGRGARLRVHLPLLRAQGARGADDPAPGTRPASNALPALDGIRVLLIDDQREARESLASLLGVAGAQVATAASGVEAIERLAEGAGDAPPEVIVCDIAMPGEDGYEVLRRIRRWESQHPHRTGRPRTAIALSAYAQRDDRLRALAAGFQWHLAKPVAPADLGGAITRAAAGHPAPGGMGLA